MRFYPVIELNPVTSQQHLAPNCSSFQNSRCGCFCHGFLGNRKRSPSKEELTGCCGMPQRCPMYGYILKDGEYGEYFNGDIELREDAELPTMKDSPLNSIVDPELVWPDGVAYYYLEEDFDETQIELIEAGIQDLVDSTRVNGEICIEILPYTGSEVDWITVRKGSGCSSNVGRQGGENTMSLADSCVTRHGTIMHEFLHAYGYWHEHTRADRDDFVYINWENIEEGREHNFEKKTEGVDIDHLGTDYDYGGVMHYSEYAFAIDSDIRTIIPYDEDAEIGQRTHLSDADIERVQILYGCLDVENSKHFKGMELAKIFER